MKNYTKSEREDLKKRGHWNLADTIFVKHIRVIVIILLGWLVGFLLWAEMDHQFLTFLWEKIT